MEKHPHVAPPADHGGPLLHAAQKAQTSALAAVDSTGRAVRKYPWPAIGIAIGTGAIVGFAASSLMNRARQPPSLLTRLGLATIVQTASRRLSKLF